MVRTIHHKGRGILLDFGQLSVLPVEGASSTPESLPQFTLPKIEKLMENFSDLFSTPFGLPPAWAHDHAIVLKEGTSPIYVRPYRYPQIVKDEIERIMAKMLTAGIIQPSTSPFSSPILLVKGMEAGDFVLTTGLSNRPLSWTSFRYPSLRSYWMNSMVPPSSVKLI